MTCNLIRHRQHGKNIVKNQAKFLDQNNLTPFTQSSYNNQNYGNEDYEEFQNLQTEEQVNIFEFADKNNFYIYEQRQNLVEKIISSSNIISNSQDDHDISFDEEVIYISPSKRTNTENQEDLKQHKVSDFDNNKYQIQFDEKKNNIVVNPFPKSNSNQINNKDNRKLLTQVFTRFGTLKKQNSKNQNKWKSVFCLVKNNVFSIYNNQEMQICKVTLNFHSISSKVELIDNLLTIIVEGSKKKFVFTHDQKEYLVDWFKDIYQNITNSQGYQKSLQYISSLPKYWKEYPMSITQFLKISDSLDIILFKSNRFGSKVQRFITSSEYDHVALILRSSKDDIYLFESTAQEGVGLCSWKNFVKNNWSLLFQKIAFRHLEIHRSNDNIDILETFVKSAIGKHYQLTPFKLLKKESIITNINAENDRTYFCTELIASAYKRLKLLPPNISSAQYWPKNFSQKFNLPLLNEAKLSREYILTLEYQ